MSEPRSGPSMWGMDWRTAPLELRERLALGDAAAVSGLLEQLAGPAVVLATCHRIEVYVEGPEQLGPALEALARRGGVSPSALHAHGAERHGEACVRHLLEVAAGLQSAMVGEPQILGQVRDALGLARQVRPPGPVLGALFERAVHAGKRVRTETALGSASPSLAREAVRRAVEGGLDLARGTVLVIGSGETAMLAAREAVGAGARRVRFCARRPSRPAGGAGRAAAPGRRRGGAGCGPHGGAAGAVGAGGPGRLRDVGARHRRGGRMAGGGGAGEAAAGAPDLWVVDLAVPRDVEVPAPMPEGLRLLGIDEVARAAEAAPRAPEGTGGEDRAAAMAIVGQETASFMEWLRQRQAAPAVVAMRRRAEAVRAQELEWALRRLDGRLAPRDREVLEAMTRRLTNKLMHLPTLYLKRMACEAGDERQERAG
ncbi:glutamyl-tRNA reductase [Geochorda subterranea]|uniref:Glutamyl-tRNA reductase n=1 Tax=Geochorda subterranea TaxID=3109564 RepID=A0ABZ1BRZ4_9FIRM|nr:hypothetical protein [Limnochorda sp. LNt]WRP14947.1 hypothetical protein VLY81_01880 [Limnochorda sp. LNt]